MSINQIATKAFLDLLDPKADAWTFQIYYPRNYSGQYVKPIHGSFADKISILDAENKKGAHVSIAVNETNLQGHAATDITSIRVICHDNDGGFDVNDFPIPPSLTIQTSEPSGKRPMGGFHHYWAFDGVITKEQYAKIADTLVETYKSDAIIKNPGLVLRLPGSVNNKGKPFQTKIGGGSRKRYPAIDILNWLAVDSLAGDDSYEVVLPPTKPLLEHEWDHAIYREWLSFIPADDYHIWLMVGGILCDACNGHTWGKRIWDEWSLKSAKFDPVEQGEKWLELTRRIGKVTNPAGPGTLHHLAKENGWVPPHDLQLGTIASPQIAKAVEIVPGKLTEATMVALRESFVTYGHNPSEAQWVGLRDLISQLEAMANGKADPLFHLSCLDPGVGKTQAICHFTKQLLKSEAHENVSVVICLGHLEEMKTIIVKDMELQQGDFAVLAADCEENRELLALGNQIPNVARVLFITQAMLLSRTKRAGNFEDATEFHYLGEPRQVRIWDEACLPARPFTVSLTKIQLLLDEASKVYDKPKLYEELKSLAKGIEEVEDGGLFDIPGLEAIVSKTRAYQIYKNQSKYVQDLVNDLWLLSEKTVVIKRSGEQNIIAHYENTLPFDLKPIVICDASGRVRQTYPHWSKARGDLVALRHGPKHYGPLTLNIWEVGGGKSAWKANTDELLRGIVATVNSKPNEEFLILHHMFKEGWFNIDVPERVKALAKNPHRLKFAHWGGEDYRATNKYKDIKNVILAGTLFYDRGYYDALGRLSRGLKSEERLSKEQLRDIELGEHANIILQAVCRGNVRMGDGGQCGECDVYVIANPNSGIPAMLRSDLIFPGAKVVAWNPVKRELTGKIKTAFNYVADNLNNPAVPLVRASDVQNAIAVDRMYWNKNIVKHPSFANALADAGIVLEISRGPTGSVFRKNVVVSTRAA
jgi:hypothetical protein